MAGSHNYWLVVLSIVVATLASFVALEFAAALAPRRPGRGQWVWLILGALAIGTGIWSMHFIGMLGFQLPVPVSYDVTLTLLSLLIAAAASAAGLVLAHRGTRGLGWLVAGGVLIGIAIAGMHYTGMAAMRMEPPIRHTSFLFSLSIFIAIAAATISLGSAFRLRIGNAAIGVLEEGRQCDGDGNGHLRHALHRNGRGRVCAGQCFNRQWAGVRPRDVTPLSSARLPCSF